MTQPHISVLYREIIHAFADLNCPIFVDGTLGAGGHAASILNAHPEITQFLGIDQDPLALAIARENLLKWETKVHFAQGNYEFLETYLDNAGIHKANGILLDIGVSSMQLDLAEKGFSFMREGPLDMRMDPKNPLTAADIVNTWSEREIARIMRDYGEDKQWRGIARTLVTAREKQPITTTTQLVDVLMPLLGWRRGQGIHPLTLTFQALRICVNDELGVLERVLPVAMKRLSRGGRLAVISFHSLEDRIVKNIFRDAASDKVEGSGLGGIFLNKTPTVKLITGKPITAQEDEIEMNPRSRSAKLRIVEKI